jgi:hypothetical protein
MTINEVLPTLVKLDEMGVGYTAYVLAGAKVSSIWISQVRQTDGNYHVVLSLVTSLFGRLVKEISAGTQSWSGSKDGTTLTMHRIAQCKVTRYRTVEKKKTIEVETDEIETEEVPVYDCAETE